MVFLSIHDDPKASEARIERYNKRQDRKNNSKPEDPESPFQKDKGWLKTAAEVQEIWGECRLCWHVAVTEDEDDDTVHTSPASLVLLVDRYDDRLFVMKTKLIDETMTVSKAHNLCADELGARVGDEKESDVLEAEGWKELLLFKDLPWDISNRHVLRYRYWEVSEDDYFKVVEGKLCGQWLSPEVEEKGKRAGGWNWCPKDGKLHPPARVTDAHEDISSLAPAYTATISGELFPDKVHKQAAADAERKTTRGGLKAEVKNNGHATLVDQNGITLGDNPDAWGKALESIEVSEKHDTVKARNFASHLIASTREANSSVSQLKGEKKRKRESPFAKEGVDSVDKQAEGHKVQESQAGRKKAKTTKVKDTSDAKAEPSEMEAGPQDSGGKSSLLFRMLPIFDEGRK